MAKEEKKYSGIRNDYRDWISKKLGESYTRFKLRPKEERIAIYNEYQKSH